MPKITLKAARVNLGYTQEQLAEKLGVSRESVLNWENGNSEIRPVYLFALAHLTGISEDDFLLPNESTKRG